MQKNVAGQKWQVFAFNRTTNVPVTGDAAQITANIRKDWGSAVATDDTNPTETEDGYYLFDLTQAETDADVGALFPESSTADVQVIATPAVVTFTAAVTGAGDYAISYYSKDSGGNPLDGVAVWITTDVAGSSVVAGPTSTNAMGLASFRLDAGTYYIWRQLAGYNFTNPQGVTVSADATVTHTDGVAATGAATYSTDYMTNLISIRLRTSQELAEISDPGTRKPSYQVDGESYSWNMYQVYLLKRLAEINKLIAQGEVDAEPFMVKSQGLI